MRRPVNMKNKRELKMISGGNSEQRSIECWFAPVVAFALVIRVRGKQ